MKLICERSHALHLPELGCYGPDAQIAALERRVAELYEDAAIHQEVSSAIRKALDDVGITSIDLDRHDQEANECFSSKAIRMLAKRTQIPRLAEASIAAKQFVAEFTEGRRGYRRDPDVADWKEFFEKLCAGS